MIEIRIRADKNEIQIKEKGNAIEISLWGSEENGTMPMLQEMNLGGQDLVNLIKYAGHLKSRGLAIPDSPSISVDTPTGILTAYPGPDTDYPEIFVDLSKPGFHWDAPIAVIGPENNIFSSDIITRVWINSYEEDPQSYVRHKGIESYYEQNEIEFSIKEYLEYFIKNDRFETHPKYFAWEKPCGHVFMIRAGGSFKKAIKTRDESEKGALIRQIGLETNPGEQIEKIVQEVLEYRYLGLWTDERREQFRLDSWTLAEKIIKAHKDKQ